MLQFDEYKVKLNNLAPTLKELAQAMPLDGAIPWEKDTRSYEPFLVR